MCRDVQLLYTLFYIKVKSPPSLPLLPLSFQHSQFTYFSVSLQKGANVIIRIGEGRLKMCIDAHRLRAVCEIGGVYFSCTVGWEIQGARIG